MDQETKKILTEQELLREITGHQGWKVVRSILADKILTLNDAFSIEEKSATAMLNDLRVRKKAAKILYDFLQEIEGTATQAEDNALTRDNKSYLFIREE